MLNKEKEHAFRKDVYLLGKDNDGIKYWLEAGAWDCEWYWGIGYVETYRQNLRPSKARDIDSHQHFDGLFLKGTKHGFDTFKEFFKESVLTDKELWTLIELMQSLYTCRKYSDMLHSGGAHTTTNPEAETIKNAAEYERINQVVIPALLNSVYDLLSPEE